VVPDSLGQVGEVHVVADPGRSAKQMVRDDLVATAARATLDAVNRTLERLFA
jgi:hypothetical protein